MEVINFSQASLDSALKPFFEGAPQDGEKALQQRLLRIYARASLSENKEDKDVAAFIKSYFADIGVTLIPRSAQNESEDATTQATGEVLGRRDKGS